MAVGISTFLVALFLFEMCTNDVGAETVRTIRPPELPPLPPLPPLKCPRPGLCPQIQRLPVNTREAESEGRSYAEPPSLCGNLCSKDEHCPLGKKCCPTTCGYACYDPVFLPLAKS